MYVTSYRDNILERSRQLIDHMIVNHNKVLLTRIDLRFPTTYPHNGLNDEAERFNKNLKRTFDYNRIDIRYLLVREQSYSHHPHYHALIIVDGNKTQNPYTILEIATRTWNGIVGSDTPGLVHLCQHQERHPIPPMEMIRRPSSLATGAQLREQTIAFERARRIALDHTAYLAKEFTKGNAPDGVREMLASQIRRS
jgi:hypothetical protein